MSARSGAGGSDRASRAVSDAVGLGVAGPSVVGPSVAGPTVAGPSVVGVDGCRAGWFAVHRFGAQVRWHLWSRIDEVQALRPRPDVVVVDMPIGLLSVPEPGGRGCDGEARRLLGARRSSVFSAPTRDVLDARCFEDAHGLSQQAYHILPKVREVDAFVTPARQRTLREGHPELAFRTLAGRPMRHPKRTADGHRERLALLRRAWPESAPIYAAAVGATRRGAVARDDIADALVLVLVAVRVASGSAERVPIRPRRDGRGLRMEMWF